MNPVRLFLICVVTALLSSVGIAADPTGIWKWTTPGRNGQPQETVLNLVLAKDGSLSGTFTDRSGMVAISNASFKANALEFSVVRETPGGKIEVTYVGRITGDTITGTNARPDNSPEAIKSNKKRQADWVATRETSKPNP